MIKITFIILCYPDNKDHIKVINCEIRDCKYIFTFKKSKFKTDYNFVYF